MKGRAMTVVFNLLTFKNLLWDIHMKRTNRQLKKKKMKLESRRDMDLLYY